jgi:hypothetical protein
MVPNVNSTPMPVLRVNRGASAVTTYLTAPAESTFSGMASGTVIVTFLASAGGLAS